LERAVNAVSDEMKRRPAIHCQIIPRMMGKYKDGCAKGRSFAPPSLPAFIGRGTTHRSKHVPPNDPGANVLKTTRDKVVVRIRSPALLAVYSITFAAKNLLNTNSRAVI